MGRRSQLPPWERNEVRDDWTEGSGGCEAPNRHDTSHTITDNIWRAYVGSWYRPRPIPNAASDLLTGKLSNEAGFGETTGKQSHAISHAWRDAQFVTEGDCNASSTHEHLPQRIASLAYYHIEIRFGQRQGIDFQIVIFDVVSWVNAICNYFVSCQLFLDFSDQIVRQDYLSVCVQGSYGPCKCCRHQIE